MGRHRRHAPTREAAEEGDGSPLHAVADLLDRRTGPRTGATEYLVQWGDQEAPPSWEPVSSMNALTEGLLGAQDVLGSRRLAQEHPRTLVPLTALSARKLLDARRRRRPRDDDAEGASLVEEGAPTTAVPAHVTANGVFHDITASVAMALPSRRADGGPGVDNPERAELLAALTSFTEEDVAAANVPKWAPTSQPPRGGKEAAVKARMKLSAIGRIGKNFSAVVGQAACTSAVLMRDDSAVAVDDDDIHVLALRRATVDMAPRGEKRHRAESQPVERNSDEGAAPEHDDASDSEDKERAVLSRPPYVVDFVVAAARNGDLDAIDAEAAPPQVIAGVRATMPLAQFRHQYPHPLIRFLVSHARLFPLPPTAERALE